jgi:tetratricopeptide (TPR) repeat protein
MGGKITIALVKREAETYRTQGLHEEALALYQRLMADSANMDLSLKETIQKQVEGIFLEKQRFDTPPGQALSPDDILRIKKGWGQEATVTDVLICAQALYQMGSYGAALQEYRNLLKNSDAPEHLVGVVTDCLIKANEPEQLPRAADALVKGLFDDKKKSLSFQLSLAKTLAAKTDKTHAIVYCSHLQNHPDLPAKVAARLASAVAKFRVLSSQPPPTSVAQNPPPPTSAAQNPPPGTSHPGFFRRLWSSFGGNGKSPRKE